MATTCLCLWLEKKFYADEKVPKTTLDKNVFVLCKYTTQCGTHSFKLHKNENFSYLNFAPASFSVSFQIHTKIFYTFTQKDTHTHTTHTHTMNNTMNIVFLGRAKAYIID